MTSFNVQTAFSLDGDVALITGSAQGLGFEIARGLAAAGATAIVHGRDAKAVEAARQRLENEGLNTDALVFDLNDEEARRAAFVAIKARHGRLDILVNNAAIRARRSLTDLSATEIQSVVHNNILSTIEICRHAVELMRPRRKGRIVTITSMQGHLVRANDFIYPITKQALETMTRVLAVEFGSHGIRCNAIAPGTFATAFNHALIQKPDNIARMKFRNPTQRWGDPAEIVGPTLFFASEASSYVNGQTLLVDGGYSISL